MNKKELLEEVLAQIQDLKKDVRDLKKEVARIADNNAIFSYKEKEVKEGNCPQCHLDVSSKYHVCMSTNCPYRMQVTCSSKL